jgi:hypothetical protein
MTRFTGPLPESSLTRNARFSTHSLVLILPEFQVTGYATARVTDERFAP